MWREGVDGRACDVWRGGCVYGGKNRKQYGRKMEGRRREGVLSIYRHADKFTSHRMLPCSHVHCSSVVNKILSPTAVLKLCPPGVSMVISSGVVMEKGGRRN